MLVDGLPLKCTRLQQSLLYRVPERDAKAHVRSAVAAIRRDLEFRV